MKIYLVGGAVRDQLLGLPVKEKDWVVVGSTPNEMRKNKFKQVGKDFPVFINPKTGEEYALARTERKSGHGYTGFEFDTNPNVTLEEDLERRDLTINAIAQDEDGTLIDPFNGQEDIKNKKLRHVSDAFSEDPLRVLRLARFNSSLEGFVVVPGTMTKIQEIVKSGELEYLTPERIWLEIYKCDNLCSFFEFLFSVNALKNLGLDETAIEIPNNRISKLEYIALYMSVNVIDFEAFCQKVKVPNEYKDLALLLRDCRYDILSYKPYPEGCDDLVSLIKRLDIRKEERLQSFLNILRFDSNFDLQFFIEIIDKIKSYKLVKEDQKKSNNEIRSIIENAHKEITKEHIKEYLNNNK